MCLALQTVFLSVLSDRKTVNVLCVCVCVCVCPEKARSSWTVGRKVNLEAALNQQVLLSTYVGGKLEAHEYLSREKTPTHHQLKHYNEKKNDC